MTISNTLSAALETLNSLTAGSEIPASVKCRSIRALRTRGLFTRTTTTMGLNAAGERVALADPAACKATRVIGA